MRKYVADRIREVVKLNDPPHKLALAFAIGVFVAFSPWIGLHIISCLFFAWIFRVSKFVVLTATFVNNPWTMVPIYAFNLWFGVYITGGSIAVPAINWSEIGFRELFTVLKPFLRPFIIGSLVVGTAVGVISYLLFFWAVRKYRRGEQGGVIQE
jgi:uncharacterized protein (DUF2062 family)